MNKNEGIATKIRKNTIRIIMYFLGIATLSLGIVINIKTELGASAVMSVACVISEITGISLGNMTTIDFIIYVIFQLIVIKDESKLKILLQIPVSIIFGKVTDIFNEHIYLPMDSIVLRGIFTILGIMIIALGVILIVKANIVHDPGNGATHAISSKFNISLGLSKNIMDVTHAVLALILSIVFIGKVVAVGIGTVLAALLVGRFVSLYEMILEKNNIDLAKLY